MKKLRLLLKRLLSYIPMPVPVGVKEYNRFVDDIIELSGQYADYTSMKFAISSVLIHAPPHKGSLSKNYFVVRMRKSAANQVASQVFQDIKTAQDAKQKAEETAKQQAVSNEEKTVN